MVELLDHRLAVVYNRDDGDCSIGIVMLLWSLLQQDILYVISMVPVTCHHPTPSTTSSMPTFSTTQVTTTTTMDDTTLITTAPSTLAIVVHDITTTDDQFVAVGTSGMVMGVSHRSCSNTVCRLIE